MTEWLLADVLVKSNSSIQGGSPGLVVLGEDSCSEGRGIKSRILDGHNIFSHIFVVKIVMFV